jgi:elongator complex protein 4
LSCSLLIAAPDLHSSYGDLVQKYFIAQGLSCNQNVCVITDDAEQFVKDVMWIPQRGDSVVSSTSGENGDNLNGLESSKIKIAWRYKQMKQFQTTVPSSSHVSFIAVLQCWASKSHT